MTICLYFRCFNDYKTITEISFDLNSHNFFVFSLALHETTHSLYDFGKPIDSLLWL